MQAEKTVNCKKQNKGKRDKAQELLSKGISASDLWGGFTELGFGRGRKEATPLSEL